MSRSNTAKGRAYQKVWRARNAEKVRAQARARYARNRERMRAEALARYHRNPESHRAASKRWKENNQEYRKQYARKNSARYHYGLSFDDFEKLRKSHNGMCGICGEPSVGRDLDIDHDHTSGKVRGLVCNRCNRLLAILESAPSDIIGRANSYLTKYASD